MTTMITMPSKVDFSQIGTNINKKVTSEEAIKLAKMDWTVEKHPLYAHFNDSKETESIPYYGIFRSDTKEWLQGIVTSRYEPLQNVDAFRFMDSIIEKSGASYEAAGVMENGSRVWLMARMPKNIEVVIGDPVYSYILMSNSHNARSSVTATFTSTRVKCSNQIRYILSHNQEHAIQVRHTSGIANSMKEASETFTHALGFFEKQESDLKALSKTAMTPKEAMDILCESFDPIDHRTFEQLPTQTQKKVELITGLFSTGIGNSTPGIKGTAYALLNAVSEFDTHHRVMRSSGESENIKRVEKVWFGKPVQVEVMKTLSRRITMS